MGALKALLIIIGCIVLVSGMMAAGVSARLEGRWALQTGNIITGEDFSIQHPMAVIFHQETSNALDLENFDLSFPAFADGLQLGPLDLGLGDFSATSNILPFGPVNLAFPSIHEDVLQSVQATSTGFFAANWAYIADTAASNVGSEPLGTRLAAGHPIKSSHMLGFEFLWPLMTPWPQASASMGGLSLDLGDGVGDMPLDYPIGNILDNAPVYHTPKISFFAGGNDTGISGNDTIQANNTVVANQTSQSQSQANKRTPTRKPRVNPASTKVEIQNMTVLKRMYRDAFIGSTMYKAYEGPTQYPTWIDPYDDGKGVFNMIDMQKILGIAHNKTLPGAHVAPVFWDL